MQDRLRKITAVALDLNGTTLSSDQSLHPLIESMISIVGYDGDDLYTTNAESEEV